MNKSIQIDSIVSRQIRAGVRLWRRLRSAMETDGWEFAGALKTGETLFVKGDWQYSSDGHLHHEPTGRAFQAPPWRILALHKDTPKIPEKVDTSA